MFICYRDLESDYDELPMDRRGSLTSMNSVATTATTDSSSSGGKVRPWHDIDTKNLTCLSTLVILLTKILIGECLCVALKCIMLYLTETREVKNVLHKYSNVQ